MTLDLTPWFVGGGAQHSAEVARGLCYASTNGSEGIARVSDLKVMAQSVPNNTVRVLTGGGLILNRYPGGAGQTYSLRNASATSVNINPTGSGGGRTDLVIARVLDPQYEGTPPEDPTTFNYSRLTVIQGVSSSIKEAQDLNLGYPAIALAKITIPASTATISQAMITDLRRVAQPKRERAMITIFPTGKWQQGTGQLIPSGSFKDWPITSAQRPSVYVPEWATRVDIVAHMSGVVYVKSSDNNTSAAAIRTMIGSAAPSQTGIICQDGDDAGNRMHYTVVGTHVITEDMRSTNQLISIQGNKTLGTGRWYGDDQTSIVIDWEFSEGAQ